MWIRKQDVGLIICSFPFQFFYKWWIIHWASSTNVVTTMYRFNECEIIKEVKRVYFDELSIVYIFQNRKPHKHCAHKYFNMSTLLFTPVIPSLFLNTMQRHISILLLPPSTTIIIIISTELFFIYMNYYFCGLSKASLNCTSVFYSLQCI